MQLDLGGIAKGYAADEALKIISSQGIKSALVAASGDLAFSDAPPGHAGWTIGIDSLDQADKPFTRTLLLANAAVSTSGGSEQFLEADGKRYSHIINPETGLGIVNEITVTTVAKRGLLADPTATAVSVLGSELGILFIRQHPGLAAFIFEKDGSQFRVVESENFPSFK
jgi:thiamine biosynthesis lipoprotein